MFLCKQTARKSQPLSQLGGRWGKIDDNAGLHTVRVALNRLRLMQYIVGELPERVKPKCIFISKKATLVRSLRNFRCCFEVNETIRNFNYNCEVIQILFPVVRDSGTFPNYISLCAIVSK